MKKQVFRFEMGFLAGLWLLFVTLVSVESCSLSGESGPFPYVVRIVNGDGTTMGHGSLVKADTVLSTCTPFLDLPSKLTSEDYAAVGYDFKRNCKQSRKAVAIEMHETCKNATLDFPLANDFALWKVKAFKVDSNSLPYLWGVPNPPMMSTIEMLIDGLNGKRHQKLKVGLFANQKSGSELQSVAEEEFVPWSDCKTDILLKISNEVMGIYMWATMFDESVQKDKSRRNYTFFCGHDKKIAWNPPKDPTVQPEADWYSGAAVSIETKPGDASSRVAIGMLGRAVTTKVPGQENFRIISGFNQGHYDLMESNGIKQSSQTASTTPKKTANQRNVDEAGKKSEAAPQLQHAVWVGILVVLSYEIMALV